jgi:hypothetical protein
MKLNVLLSEAVDATAIHQARCGERVDEKLINMKSGCIYRRALDTGTDAEKESALIFIEREAPDLYIV